MNLRSLQRSTKKQKKKKFAGMKLFKEFYHPFYMMNINEGFGMDSGNRPKIIFALDGLDPKEDQFSEKNHRFRWLVSCADMFQI